MTLMAIDYLRLDEQYAEALGISYTFNESLFVTNDGTALAFPEELASMVEGFASAQSLVPFVYLIHFLALCKGVRGEDNPEMVRLSQAFRNTKASVQNAGVLAAKVCSDLPNFPLAPHPVDVCAHLRNKLLPTLRYAVEGEAFPFVVTPPLNAAEFESRVASKISRMTDEELQSWLRNGTELVSRKGTGLLRELLPPRTLSGALARLLERPRLAPARSIVSVLMGALTLPQPELSQYELPVGGYTDVMTKGNIDQLLPSQFALDEDEFFRRFVENELLYFRREVPGTKTDRRYVIVLDQGVRTWGQIRLVLVGAFLTLGKQAVRQKLDFWFATTGNRGRLVDLVSEDEDTIGTLVEASDFERDPGLALEEVLLESSEVPREVVLLTHRRNVLEENVGAAARRLGKQDRLFAVGLDDRGDVQLSQFRRGVPVVLREFRIDLTRLNPPPEPRDASTSPRGSRFWTGDVEAVGYPFQLGLNGVLLSGMLAFDRESKHLLTVSKGGLLYVWRLDGSGMEILPRGLYRGQFLCLITSVVGVSGGFVVIGVIEANFVVFHYDFSTHRCKAYDLSSSENLGPVGDCRYFSRTHTMIFVFPETGQQFEVDLKNQTGAVIDASAALGFVPIAGTALESSNESQPRNLKVVTDGPENELGPGSVYLNSQTGRVRLTLVDRNYSFVPTSDGKPSLKDHRLWRAQCHGSVLAIQTEKGMSCSVWLFDVLTGAVLREYPSERVYNNWLLSEDGAYMAVQSKLTKAVVRKTRGSPLCILSTDVGMFSQGIVVRVSRGAVVLQSGQTQCHKFEWWPGELRMSYHRELPSDDCPGGVIVFGGLEARERKTRGHLPLGISDTFRWVDGTTAAGVTFLVDLLGQVALIDDHNELICMFFAFRGKMAAWMPDGTQTGDTRLLTGGKTPDANRKIAKAILNAQTSEAHQ
ncbi:MAG: hypothetical protein ACFCD0_13740 [Gemmataceae bacterium]